MRDVAVKLMNSILYKNPFNGKNKIKHILSYLWLYVDGFNSLYTLVVDILSIAHSIKNPIHAFMQERVAYGMNDIVS